MGKPCKDCGSTTRPLARDAEGNLVPGPRCATCHRARRRVGRLNAWAAYLLRTYRMTQDQYWALYELQGGKCAWCQRATGKTKRLAVDHDHSCCPEVPTCGKCTRGLLCGPCNDIEGKLTLAGLYRAIDYLLNPPFKKLVS